MTRTLAIHDLPELGATNALARSLARVLRPGDVVTLDGDLGAGKTTLVRALARALNVPDGAVSSPTFVVINQYSIPPARGQDALPLAGGQLIHVDAYRVHEAPELENAGWDHLFDMHAHPIGAAAAIIEWPSRIEDAIAHDACQIALEATGQDSRRAAIAMPKAWIEGPNARDAARRMMDSAPTRCRITGDWVEATRPSYPFATDQARLADLHKWFSGERTISRDIRPEDDEDLGLA